MYDVVLFHVCGEIGLTATLKLPPFILRTQTAPQDFLFWKKFPVSDRMHGSIGAMSGSMYRSEYLEMVLIAAA